MAVKSAPPTEEQAKRVAAVDVTSAIQQYVRPFTVTEYHRMAEVGILHEDDIVDLIEGRIVEMSPKGSEHVWCVNRLNRLFARRGDVSVSVQNPIRLGDR